MDNSFFDITGVILIFYYLFSVSISFFQRLLMFSYSRNQIRIFWLMSKCLTLGAVHRHLRIYYKRCPNSQYFLRSSNILSFLSNSLIFFDRILTFSRCRNYFVYSPLISACLAWGGSTQHFCRTCYHVWPQPRPQNNHRIKSFHRH